MLTQNAEDKEEISASRYNKCGTSSYSLLLHPLLLYFRKPLPKSLKSRLKEPPLTAGKEGAKSRKLLSSPLRY